MYNTTYGGFLRHVRVLQKGIEGGYWKQVFFIFFKGQLQVWYVENFPTLGSTYVPLYTPQLGIGCVRMR